MTGMWPWCNRKQVEQSKCNSQLWLHYFYVNSALWCAWSRLDKVAAGPPEPQWPRADHKQSKHGLPAKARREIKAWCRVTRLSSLRVPGTKRACGIAHTARENVMSVGVWVWSLCWLVISLVAALGVLGYWYSIGNTYIKPTSSFQRSAYELFVSSLASRL